MTRWLLVAITGTLILALACSGSEQPSDSAPSQAAAEPTSGPPPSQASPTPASTVQPAAAATSSDQSTFPDTTTADLVITGLCGSARDYLITAGLSKDDVEFLKFFPEDLTIFTGDTVTWETAGTEVPSVVMFTSGAPAPEFLIPEPQEAGPPIFLLNAALLPPQGGDTYSGTGVASSGFLLGAAGSPGAATTYTLKFDRPGSYDYSSIPGLPFQLGRINVVDAPATPSVGDATLTPLVGSLAGLLGLILVLGGGYLIRRRIRS